MEAVYYGCYPLAPNALVYPEIYPPECLFSDVLDLKNRLKQFCLDPSLAIEAREKINVDFNQYSSKTIVPKFKEIINNL